MLLVTLAAAAQDAANTSAAAPTPVAPAWAAPGTILQSQLPEWFQIDAQFRDRVEYFGGIGFKPPRDFHDLTQLRIRFDIRARRWLTFVGEAQDARIFFNHALPDAPPYQNILDIRQAYVQLGDSAGWIDAVAGRQNLTFGDERVIGPSDWLNQGRTFDVARLDLHHRWFGLSLFASSVILARDGVVDHHYQGNNLHGAYGSLKNLVPGATIEPYVLWRVAPAGLHLSENAGRGALSEFTFGLRLDGKVSALEYNVEMDHQTGTLGPDSIDAYAGHWNFAHTFGGRAKPRPFLEANYASGARNPNGNKWSTFDQLYPSSHDKLDFADQVGWRNIEQVRAGISENAGKKWKFTETYEDFWLATARDALYTASGAPVAQSLDGRAGRHVGQEFDAWAEWNWKKIVELGFGYGVFLTGPYLDRTTSGKNFNYPFVYFTYHLTQVPNK